LVDLNARALSPLRQRSGDPAAELSCLRCRGELRAERRGRDAGVRPEAAEGRHRRGTQDPFAEEEIGSLWSADVSRFTILSEPANLYGLEFNYFVLEESKGFFFFNLSFYGRIYIFGCG